MEKVGITGADAVYPEHGRNRGASFTYFHPDDDDDWDRFGLVTITETSKESNPSLIVGLLVHESVHAFQWVCRCMNEKAGPSKEFEAYGIQMIFQFMEAQFSETRKWDDATYNKATKHRRTAT